MSRELVAALAARLVALSPDDRPLVLAVSGGPDSVALLDLAVQGAEWHRRDLVVGHVDHGILPASGAVAERVAALAAARGLPCRIERLALGSACSETVARRHRRAGLRAIAARAGAGAIALAHHADDQAETVLLRMLRGSGPAGLAGMAPRRGIWIRPLLGVTRDELRRHLDATGLSAWHDPANSDPRHLRSWLRTVVSPVLQQRVPDLRDRLLEVAEQAGRNRRAWNRIPALLDGLDLRVEERCLSVAAPTLRGYRSVVQHAVLAALGRRLGVPLGRRRIARLEALVRQGRSGSRVTLSPVLEAEIAFDRLILGRPVDRPLAPLRLPDEGTISFGPVTLQVRSGSASESPGRIGGRTVLVPGSYLVRSWRPGDRIRPLGGTGSRPVVVLLREARIAASRRRTWPVIEAADATIVWVPGICRATGWFPERGEEALHVECDLA